MHTRRHCLLASGRPRDTNTRSAQGTQLKDESPSEAECHPCCSLWRRQRHGRAEVWQSRRCCADRRCAEDFRPLGTFRLSHTQVEVRTCPSPLPGLEAGNALLPGLSIPVHTTRPPGRLVCLPLVGLGRPGPSPHQFARPDARPGPWRIVRARRSCRMCDLCRAYLLPLLRSL